MELLPYRVVLPGNSNTDALINVEKQVTIYNPAVIIILVY